MTLLDVNAITVAGYQARTGDDLASDAEILTALDDAEQLLDEELRRTLAYGSHTETMRIHDDGRMYPRAWPLVACDTNTIDGRALLGGTPDVAQFIALVGVNDVPARATVTYDGGFDDGTDSEPLPIVLRDALYDLTAAILASSPAAPTGVVSASVGDVTVTYARPSGSGVDAYVPGLSARVARYRNRFV